MHSQIDSTDGAVFPSRYARLLIWAGSILLGLLIPLKILSLGYLPPDDALRHAAKVVSGKPWPDILVLREGFAEDQHPGWHAILGAAHKWFHLDTDGLVWFSSFALFLVFWLAMVSARRRPEAMLAAMFAASVTAPGTIQRIMFGRPFIVSMAVCMILLQLWTSGRVGHRLRMILTTLLVAVSVWIHGSWYLFGIMIAAFVLAGEWRKTVGLGVCFATGILLAGCLAGRPLGYPAETLRHLFYSFGGQPLERMLVTEFKSSVGDVVTVLVVVLTLIWRVARGRWQASAVCNPVFMLMALGWLLGLKVSRFWTDWGFPAALLWLALEWEEVIEEKLAAGKYPNFLLAAFAAAGMYIATTRDLGDRWTSVLTIEYLTPETPNIAGWLPEPGGIVYSTDMAVFYRTFNKNPHAEWRYLLGFEPGLMPQDDLDIYRKIQWNWFVGKAYEPWVKKMRPEDRMILLRGAGSPPGISGLEWLYAAADTWVGRLPRTNSVPVSKP